MTMGYNTKSMWLIRNSVSICCLGMRLKEAASVLSVLIMVGANTTARLRVVILFVSLCCTTLFLGTVKRSSN